MSLYVVRAFVRMRDMPANAQHATNAAAKMHPMAVTRI